MTKHAMRFCHQLHLKRIELRLNILCLTIGDVNRVDST